MDRRGCADFPKNTPLTLEKHSCCCSDCRRQATAQRNPCDGQYGWRAQPYVSGLSLRLWLIRPCSQPGILQVLCSSPVSRLYHCSCQKKSSIVPCCQVSILHSSHLLPMLATAVQLLNCHSFLQEPQKALTFCLTHAQTSYQNRQTLCMQSQMMRLIQRMMSMKAGREHRSAAMLTWSD